MFQVLVEVAYSLTLFDRHVNITDIVLILSICLCICCYFKCKSIYLWETAIIFLSKVKEKKFY